MKTIKILFFTLILAAAMGCDPTDMVTYEARNDEAFFETSSHSMAVTPADANTYTITVSRGNSAGAASVPVSIQCESEGIFDGPAAVEFADGELYAEYTVSFDMAALTIGVPVDAVITIGNETQLPYSTQFVLSVMRDYTWENYATGTFISEFMSAMTGSDVSFPVVMQNAAENTNLYRLCDVYAEGSHIQFTWDGSGPTIGFEEIDGDGYTTINTGLEYGTYGFAYLYVDSNVIYTHYNSGEFVFNGYAFVEAGQLTDYLDETFVMDQSGN